MVLYLRLSFIYLIFLLLFCHSIHFENKVFSSQLSLYSLFYTGSFRSFVFKKFMFMNSLFLQFKVVNDSIFIYLYLSSSVDFLLLSNSLSKLFFSFSLRRNLNFKSLVRFYFNKKIGSSYSFNLDNVYDRFNYYKNQLIFIPLKEKVLDKLTFKFLPFRSSFHFFSNIKNLFLNNLSSFGWVVDLHFVLYFSNSSFKVLFFTELLNINNVKNFYINSFQTFSSFMFLNIFFHFYIFVLSGLV